MDWSNYYYLGFVAGVVAIAAAVLAYLAPRLSEHQEEPHRTAPEVCMLLVVLVLGCTTMYYNYYTGSSYFCWWDIGSDTLEQYVPYYLNLLRSLREGTLGLWNFQFGLGTSFMSYQSWTLDPFNLVVLPICLIFGDSFLSLALVVAQSVKIVLAGLLFDHLLVGYCHTPLARLLGSSLYAFCGYLTLWGQHYWLGGICVVSVALLVALESLMRRWTVPRFLAVASLSALSIITSAYIGFMVMLFAASYALVRVIHVSQCRSVGQFLHAYGALALPAVCGVMISCITLIPYAALMLGESTRIAGNTDSSLFARALAYLKAFVPKEWILPVLSRSLANSLVSSGEPIPADVIPPSSTMSTVNVFEFISLGLSCGALVLLLQFAHWVITEAQWRDKLLASIGVLFGLLYCFNAFLPALNNVFAEVKYRSSFTVCILVCIALAVALEKRVVEGKPSRPLLYLGGLTSLAAICWSLVHTVNGRLVCLAFLVATVMVVFLMELQIRQAGNETVIVSLLCLTLVGSSVVDGFFTTNLRLTTSADDFPLALEPNKASSTASAIAYLKEMDPTYYRIEKLDYFEWTLPNDCLVQGYPAISSYNSTLASDVDEFYSRMWPGIYATDTAYQLFRYDPNHPELLNMLGVRYMLSEGTVNLPGFKELTAFGRVHVYRNMGDVSVLSFKTTTITESAFEQLGEADAKVLADAVIVPDDAEIPSLAHATIGVPATEEVTLDGQRLRARAATDQRCVACLAIPHVSGWTVQVDGRPVDTFRANYGFIGFVLEPGTHDITARFMPRSLVAGAAVSIAGLLLALASCVIGRRRTQA